MKKLLSKPSIILNKDIIEILDGMCNKEDTFYDKKFYNFFQISYIVIQTKEQNHILSGLDDDFFNKMQKFRDKIYLEGVKDIKPNGEIEVIPKDIIYIAPYKRISRPIKTSMINMFYEKGVKIELDKNLSEVSGWTIFRIK